MSDARGRALDYLAAHHVATLSTHGPDGPWAAAVFYVNEGFDLLFVSSPASRHARDIARNSRAAATVQEDYADWRAIKGVQLEGEVRALEGEEADRARERHGARFPLVPPGMALPEPVAAALAKSRWYRLVAQRAHFVDNAAGFGRRATVLGDD